MKKGDIVVFESTVYPGCTEDECVPQLEAASGLTMGEDFFVAYSPERINPGDKVNTVETIVKVVGACDEPTLDTVARTYDLVVQAGRIGPQAFAWQRHPKSSRTPSATSTSLW